MGIKVAWEKIKDVLMPQVDAIEDEEYEENEEADEEIEESRKIVNGGSQYVSVGSRGVAGVAMQQARPKLTLHTNQVPEFSVSVHVPTTFDQVAKVADDLLAKRAVIVNFEQLDENECRRISDFANGSCYVLDGEARRISDTMILYVPQGVSVSSLQTFLAHK